MVEAETVEQSRDRGTGIFASSVEDAVAEGVFLELILGMGAGLGLKILVSRGQQTGGTGVNPGSLVIDGGYEELRGGKSHPDRPSGDVNIFRPELRQVDACDRLAMDDKQ